VKGLAGSSVWWPRSDSGLRRLGGGTPARLPGTRARAVGRLAVSRTVSKRHGDSDGDQPSQGKGLWAVVSSFSGRFQELLLLSGDLLLQQQLLLILYDLHNLGCWAVIISTWPTAEYV
jgi:hypothetical protein